MLPIALAPSTFSICSAASGAAFDWPSQEVTAEENPAALNRFRNPPRPPGTPVISVRPSRMSGPAFAPSPNRCATSSMSASKIAMEFPFIIGLTLAKAEAGFGEPASDENQTGPFASAIKGDAFVLIPG